MGDCANPKTYLLLAAFSLMLMSSAMARTIYVDANAAGANHGSSWANAYNFLQDALVDANSSQKPVEIRVAQGIYKPDQGAGITPGDREATFQLINDVILKGGYAGFGEPDPNERDIELYETILSGDLDGNDVDVNDPRYLWYESTRQENSYHVVTGSGTDETAVLDGFTITGGNDDRMDHYEPIGYGSGMLNESGSPTVSNCTFSCNSTSYEGGGMYNDHSSPTLINCTFNGNVSGSCGGMVNEYSSPTLRNCTFRNNTACGTCGSIGAGGGMCNSQSSVILTNCTFSGNAADCGGAMANAAGNLVITNCMFICNYGSGMENSNSSPVITNSTFIGNYWNGIMNYGSSPILTNCTFSGNSAVWSGAGIYNYKSQPTLTNCILWGDSNEIWNDENSTMTITYSDIEGGWPGEGNINVDPCFIQLYYSEDPCNTPYYPWDDVWIDGDYHLLEDSPCINAGDPNYIAEPNETDLDGKPRVIGGRVDMGAYEYSPPISAEVRIVPRTINLQSKGKWINAFLWLPEDYNVIDIDSSSVLLEDEIEPQWVWFDEEEQVAMVRFSREEVRDILTVGEVELTITGQFTDGTIFEAKDVIIVIDKGSRKSAKQEKTK